MNFTINWTFLITVYLIKVDLLLSRVEQSIAMTRTHMSTSQLVASQDTHKGLRMSMSTFAKFKE